MMWQVCGNEMQKYKTCLSEINAYTQTAKYYELKNRDIYKKSMEKAAFFEGILQSLFKYQLK